MTELRDLVQKVRSKNAGPFWLTVDIFCGSLPVFDRVRRQLSTTVLAGLFGADASAIKRFELGDLSVIKFSMPRPVVQGNREDRDMHGAGWAALVGELKID